MKQHSFFSNKKITMLGLGVLGRGIAVAQYLSRHGAYIHITDKKTPEQLASSLEQLQGYHNITYHLGGHSYEDIDGADMLIKAPSVPLDSPYIQYAKDNDIPIEMDASLFFKLKPEGVTVVGITGTRGKSSVSYMLYEILSKSGKSSFLGGNVKGGATLPLLDVVKEGNIIILELDSWQLQGFGDSKLSPEVAVFTTFFPDHLNYYNNDMQSYFNDKAHIFRFQKDDQTLIVTDQSKEQIKKYYHQDLTQNVICLTSTDYNHLVLKTPGEHTKVNAGIAIKSAELFGVEKSVSEKILSEFPGIPYRLEFIKTLNEIDYYNDSNATSPDAVQASLEAFKGKHTSLIAGGTDKQLVLLDLANSINYYKPQLTLLPGTATEKLKPLLKVSFTEVSSMKEAVEHATLKAKKGGIVLLSPGSASFGLFVNEYDRGDQFRDIVLNYTDRTNEKVCENI